MDFARSKRLIPIIAIAFIALGIIGCHSYAPNAGHEIVLIKKPIFFGHGHDEAAKNSRQQQRRNIRHISRLREEMPGPGGGRKSTDRQNSRLVDGAVQRHSIRRINRAAVRAAGQILKGLLTQGRIRRFH